MSDAAFTGQSEVILQTEQQKVAPYTVLQVTVLFPTVFDVCMGLNLDLTVCIIMYSSKCEKFN